MTAKGGRLLAPLQACNRKRTPLAGVTGVVLLAGVVLVCWDSIVAEYAFTMLYLHRKGADDGRPYAEMLAGSRAGLRLCLDDIDAIGGSTRGWSAWALLNSTDRDFVLRSVNQIASDDTESRSRRVEAFWLLWDMLRQPEALDQVFLLVRDPGRPEVHVGRGRLAGVLAASPRASTLIQPRDTALELTLDEFRDIVSESGILNKTLGPEGTGP